MTKEPTDVQHFESPGDFRSWLEEHHEDRDELWVGYWKKATRKPSVTWEETVDEALCFGWIDGIRQKLSDEAYAIRFTPRRRGSTWSRRNMGRYAELEASGQIQAAGRAAYDRRIEEKTGTYSFEQEKPLELSPEFEARLRANEGAWPDWEQRPPGYKRKMTHWVMSAKQEATRERRLSKLIEDLAAGRA